jgi:hypothetical protein
VAVPQGRPQVASQARKLREVPRQELELLSEPRRDKQVEWAKGLWQELRPWQVTTPCREDQMGMVGLQLRISRHPQVTRKPVRPIHRKILPVSMKKFGGSKGTFRKSKEWTVDRDNRRKEMKKAMMVVRMMEVMKAMQGVEVMEGVGRIGFNEGFTSLLALAFTSKGLYSRMTKANTY